METTPPQITDAQRRDPSTRAALEGIATDDPLMALTIGMPLSVSVWLAKDRERIDFGPMAVITDHASKRTVRADRRDKSARKLFYEDPRDLAETPSPKTFDTGRTRKILGHLTHEFMVKARDLEGKTLTMRMWIAKDLSPFPAFARPLYRAFSTADYAALASAQGAVLRLEMPMPTKGRPESIPNR